MRGVFAARTAGQSCAYFLDRLKPTDKILDVGCGPGSITIDLAKLVPEGRVVGVDISHDSVERARKAAEDQGITNVEFFTMDVHKLSERFTESSFDVVHGHMAVMHFPEPVKVLRTMRALLKPGGILVSRDCAHPEFYPVLPGIQKQRALYEQIQRGQGAHPDGGRFNHVWAHQAGFGWDQIDFGVAASQIGGSAAARSMLVQGTKMAMRELAVQKGLVTEQEWDETAAAWEQWEQREDARFVSLDGWIVCQK